jgi:hypothetical protein
MNEDSSSDDGDDANVEQPDYYRESLTSEVAFTRTAEGKVKFEKRKREADGEEGTTGKNWNVKAKKQRAEGQTNYDKMLGRQYKSKRASGDVKRAGMPDPHAYIELSAKIVGNKYILF